MKKRIVLVLSVIILLIICIHAGADLANDKTKRIEIPPSGYHIVYYDKETQEFKENEAIEDIHGLPFNAVEAIIRSPKWIRKDLINNFCRLYKIPIEAGKGAKLAFEDVSSDGKKDLVVKCVDGTIRVFIAPYWKSASPADKEEKLQIKTSKLEDIVYHDITDDGILDKVGVAEDGIIYFQKNFGTNQKPYYLDYIKASKKMFDIKEERLVSPAFGDINGDKKTDLIIGNKKGEIKVYYGPDFKKSEILPVKVNGYSKPVVCDFNKDGVLDLIVGCKDGKIYGFTGSEHARPDSYLGGWEEESMLFKNINVSSHSAPAICDIDNDGDNDLCVGSADGQLLLFESTPQGYVFKPGYFDRIKCGDFVSPCFYDINQDGKTDLIAGNIKGEIGVFLAPDWRPDTTFFSLNCGQEFTAPCFYDTNNDGVNELTVGTASGSLIYYENTSGNNWQEQNSWNFVPHPGINSINDYYTRYYPEKEELLGMNDSKTLAAYVELLANAEEKYVDEIAFSLAHTPSEVLRAMNKMGNKDIIVENVRSIYEIAGKLSYVRLIEKEDYTTLSYAIEPNVFKPIPRDIYYWWIVHPLIYAEIPAKIDASYWTHDWKYYGISEEKWTRDTGGLKIYKQTSDSHFWRSFLPYDTRYGPSLFSQLKDVPTINHALYRLSYFIRREHPGGIVPYGRRSNDLQPMVIYMKSYGSCGEQAIIYTACLRTFLIPAAPVGCRGEDHIWADYYLPAGEGEPDGKWYTFGSATKMGTPQAELGSEISVISRNWGNGYSDDVTETVSNVIPGAIPGYSKTAELNIRVIDKNGRGIDGALVALRSCRMQEKYIAETGYTDPEGRIKFKPGSVAQNHGVFIDVISPWGIGGISKFAMLLGKEYDYTIQLPGTTEYYKPDKIINQASVRKPSCKAALNFHVISEHQYPDSKRKISDSEFTKEFGYSGNRPIRRPNCEMNGIYAYLADSKAARNLIENGIMEIDRAVERKLSGQLSREYEHPEDMAIVFFNKNTVRTYIELEYDLALSASEQKAPEIKLTKYYPITKTGEQCLFQGTCRDNLRIARLMFSDNDGKSWQEISQYLNRKKGEWQYQWDTSNLLPGVYCLKFRVEDDDNLYAETLAIEMKLQPNNKFHNIKIYQDNSGNPLSANSWVLGPFCLNPDESFLDLETRSSENLDVDMFLYMDRNGNRIIDGKEEEIKKSDGPTPNEHIFMPKPVTTSVYWIVLHGCTVPPRDKKENKISTAQLITLDTQKFKEQYQYAYVDLELSFMPNFVLLRNLRPVGIVYSGEPVKIKGEFIDRTKIKSCFVKMDEMNLTSSLLWEGNSFSCQLEPITITQKVTHTITVDFTTINGDNDSSQWTWVLRPKPDVTIDYSIDEMKEWMVITAHVTAGAMVEYIKFKIDDTGIWENIPDGELTYRKYIWQIRGVHRLIVEYKTNNETDTIVKSINIENARFGYGQQLDDIVIFPANKAELTNSVTVISIFIHKRVGEIKELNVWLDEQLIKTDISGYGWGRVATYIPEKPYSTGKHSVAVKVKTSEGKEIEKSIEFEIKPIK